MSNERNKLMFAYMFALLERVKVDRKGVTAMEYAVMAGAIVVTLSLAMTAFYSSLKTAFSNIATGI
jgi:Flp pilus assembly pilin Flp